MKSSLLAVAACAVLAAAGPLKKRAMTTEWVTEFVTVTVTADDSEPTPEIPAVFVETEVVTLTPSAPPEVKPTPVFPDFPSVEIKPSTSIFSPPPKPTVIQPKPEVSTPAAPPPPATTSAAPPPPPATTSAAPPPSPSSGNSGSYADKMVQIHNECRSKHSSPDLKWDQNLAISAEKIAKSCKFAHQMDVDGGGYGQNIAAASSDKNSNPTDFGVNAVGDMWYKGEVKNYTPKFYLSGPSNVPLGDYGHFTQVVWKSTTFVGCATVSCGAGTVFGMPSLFTVCNYKVPGNVGGEYPENVLPPKTGQ
ncbi:putative effector 14 [Metarhizium guizhouense ARSEF 977]|uniref:Effector 14 n=1 Tax=Metarhizium guizhouense (strain ARSEF 977) TaxID=1276136 RepID=A0A0B4I4I6_METGA|nr:putative effector 14 [Metarhizium guizhouense ARSEF 977]